jgi:hypothetical protein
MDRSSCRSNASGSLRPEATPTTDPAEIRTQVANTVQAGLTQTAAAEPTSTPTNTPEPTSTPTVATPTLSVTSTARQPQHRPTLWQQIKPKLSTFRPPRLILPAIFLCHRTVKNIGDTTLVIQLSGALFHHGLLLRRCDDQFWTGS